MKTFTQKFIGILALVFTMGFTANAQENLLTQEIEINAGWNFISFNVIPLSEDLAINNVLGLNWDDLSSIHSLAEYASFYEEYGWYGSLEDISIGSAYKLHSGEPHIVTLTGTAIQESVIELVPGWNWVPYNIQYPANINEVLTSINGFGVEIKSENRSAQYYEGIGWFGTLETMQPGEGYAILMDSYALLDYNFNSQEVVDPGDVIYPEILGVSFNPYLYNHSMVIGAALLLDEGETVLNNDDILLAYDSDEVLRGVGFPIVADFPSPYADEILFEMMIYGDSDDVDEEIYLRYYDN